MASKDIVWDAHRGNGVGTRRLLVACACGYLVEWRWIVLLSDVASIVCFDIVALFPSEVGMPCKMAVKFVFGS